MNAVTLTRDEAVTVAVGLTLTCVECDIQVDDIETSEQCHAIARRPELEAAVRDGGDWWVRHGPDATSPDAVDWYARREERDRPESFTMSAAGAAALAELLPEMAASAARALADDIARPCLVAVQELVGQVVTEALHPELVERREDAF
jgi:hypothetical protein